MGTMRWAVMLVAGFAGILYLTSGLTPVFNGRLELAPTVVDIAEIEANGFPDAHCLEVIGAAVVFAEADLDMREEPDEEGRRLQRLAAPLVSPELATAWHESKKAGQPLDLSRLRMVVQFTAEQLEERWPGMVGLVEQGKTPAMPAVTLTVVGETVPFRYLLATAVQSRSVPDSLQKDVMRGMRFEKQEHSLGNVASKTVSGLFWLTLAFGMLMLHRRRPPRPARGDSAIEVAALAGEQAIEDEVDADVEIDID